MIPRLIHPVEIVVEQVDPALTTIDATFNEPVGTPAVRTVTLSGQIREKSGQELRMRPGGADALANSTGHVVFDIDALEAAGVVLAVGNRIVSVAGAPTKHRVLKIDDHAHYAGRAYHRWAHFHPEDA